MLDEISGHQLSSLVNLNQILVLLINGISFGLKGPALDWRFVMGTPRLWVLFLSANSCLVYIRGTEPSCGQVCNSIIIIVSLFVLLIKDDITSISIPILSSERIYFNMFSLVKFLYK